MKTHATTADIPARYSYATAKQVLRETDKPEYNAHGSYQAALNHAAKTGRLILRRYASTKSFVLVA